MRSVVAGIALVVVAASCSGSPASEQVLDQIGLPAGATVLSKRTEGIGSTMEFAAPETLTESSIAFPSGSQPKLANPSTSCDNGITPAPAGCTARYIAGSTVPNPSAPGQDCRVSVFERNDTVDVNGSARRRSFAVVSCSES